MTRKTSVLVGGLLTLAGVCSLGLALSSPSMKSGQDVPCARPAKLPALDALIDAGWSEAEARQICHRAAGGDWQLNWLINCLTVTCWTRAEAEAALEEYRVNWRARQAEYRAALRCYLVERGLVDWWTEYWQTTYVDEITGQQKTDTYWLGEAPAENPCE